MHSDVQGMLPVFQVCLFSKTLHLFVIAIFAIIFIISVITVCLIITVFTVLFIVTVITVLFIVTILAVFFIIFIVFVIFIIFVILVIFINAVIIKVVIITAVIFSCWIIFLRFCGIISGLLSGWFSFALGGIALSLWWFSCCEVGCIVSAFGDEITSFRFWKIKSFRYKEK